MSQVIEGCKSPCSFIGFIFIEVEEVLLRLFITFLDSESFYHKNVEFRELLILCCSCQAYLHQLRRSVEFGGFVEVSTCGVTSTRGPLCVAISLLGVPVSALVICWSQGLALSDSELDPHFGGGSTSDVWKFHGDSRKTLKLAASSSFSDVFDLDVTEFLFGDCAFRYLYPQSW